MPISLIMIESNGYSNSMRSSLSYGRVSKRTMKYLKVLQIEPMEKSLFELVWAPENWHHLGAEIQELNGNDFGPLEDIEVGNWTWPDREIRAIAESQFEVLDWSPSTFGVMVWRAKVQPNKVRLGVLNGMIRRG